MPRLGLEVLQAFNLSEKSYLLCLIAQATIAAW
jgi:hypothetical protein